MSITEILVESFSATSAEIISALNTILPYAVAVVGVVMVVDLGIKAFKTFSK